MKKLFYISLALSLFSCSSSDDSTEDTPSPITQMEKAYVYCTDGVGEKPNPTEYYELTYENGNLTRVKGRFYPVFMQVFNRFFFDPITKLTYSGNIVTVSELQKDGNASSTGYHEYRYIMENNRPQKAEHYYVYSETGPSVPTTRIYTYEQDKIKKIHSLKIGVGKVEFFTTYYYDDKNNLTKSEFLEKHNGKGEQLITTTYSDFDNAENPFKKLYLLNDTFYEKSLSANNFRTKESIVESLNPNSTIPPKITKKTWNYKYDANGQLLLYYPYP